MVWIHLFKSDFQADTQGSHINQKLYINQHNELPEYRHLKMHERLGYSRNTVEISLLW